MGECDGAAWSAAIARVAVALLLEFVRGPSHLRNSRVGEYHGTSPVAIRARCRLWAADGLLSLGWRRGNLSHVRRYRVAGMRKRTLELAMIYGDSGVLAMGLVPSQPDGERLVAYVDRSTPWDS